MVMEASPSPQSVGREFVRQYYTLLNKAPTHLHRFYNNYSSFVHGGLDAPNRETLPVVGQKQIHNRIQQLNFRDCHAKISQVDAQATLGNGVVVQVTGELSNGGAPMRRFTQTFVLAAQAPKQYYVHNDIFRYQDIVVSDEEGSLGARSEGSEDEGYLPPPHYPRRASPPPPPPLQLNGHPPAQSIPPNPAANVGPVPVAAPPVAPAAPAAPAERSPEPEPAPSPPPPTPPPQLQELQTATPQPAAPPEPKTYANLVKSGAAPAPRADGPAREPPQEPRPPRRHPAAGNTRCSKLYGELGGGRAAVQRRAAAVPGQRAAARGRGAAARAVRALRPARRPAPAHQVWLAPELRVRDVRERVVGGGVPGRGAAVLRRRRRQAQRGGEEAPPRAPRAPRRAAAAPAAPLARASHDPSRKSSLVSTSPTALFSTSITKTPSFLDQPLRRMKPIRLLPFRSENT